MTTDELVFDRSVWETAEACASAWGTDYIPQDMAWLESEDGENFLVKSVAVLLPERLAEYARLRGLGRADL